MDFQVKDFDGTWKEIVLPSIGDRYSGVWKVTLGGQTIGEIHRMEQHSYAAISYTPKADLLGPRSVSGFHTRLDAVEYILMVSGYRGTFE